MRSLKNKKDSDDVIDDDKLMEMIDKNAKYNSIDRKKPRVKTNWPKFDFKGEGLSPLAHASPHDLAR